MKLNLSRHIFDGHSNIKFHKNPSSGSWVVPCGQTDGQTDMTKLTVGFDKFANAPKNTHDHKNVHVGYYWAIHIKIHAKQELLQRTETYCTIQCKIRKFRMNIHSSWCFSQLLCHWCVCVCICVCACVYVCMRARANNLHLQLSQM
jgi:hypothetical protein